MRRVTNHETIDSQRVSTPTQIPKMLLDINEAASALSVSPPTLWRMIARREIPSLTLGRRRLIPVAELELWISERLRGGAA